MSWGMPALLLYPVNDSVHECGTGEAEGDKIYFRRG